MAKARKDKSDETPPEAPKDAGAVPGVPTATLADLTASKAKAESAQQAPAAAATAASPAESAPPKAPETTADMPPLPKPDPKTVPKRKKYRVLEDREVPRGASSFILRKGKVISELGYDIEAMKSAGVKLEEVTD